MSHTPASTSNANLESLQRTTPLGLEDPSEIYRPSPPEFKLEVEDAERKFRDYDNLEGSMTRVKKTYYEMHSQQTHAYAKRQAEKYSKGIIGKYTVMEMLDLVGQIIDESDPDTTLTNDIHMYQTAERIRERYPDLEWFALVGLLHDLGKILALKGEPQWAVVGDTFITGCQPSPNVVFGMESFKNNPDICDERMLGKYGMYQANCGLENVVCSWGHDEYMYQVLTRNNSTIPEEGLYCIRFHSLYPWHHHGDYDHLCTAKDRSMLKWVQTFSSFDLYSKDEVVPDVAKIKPYYEGLIAKYCPGKLTW